MEFKKPTSKSTAANETLARLQLRTLRESHEATQRTLLLQNKQRMELNVLSPLERMRSIQRGLLLHQQQKQEQQQQQQQQGGRGERGGGKFVTPSSPLPRKKTTNSISSLLRRYVLHALIIGSYALLLFYATISSSLPGGNAAGRLAIGATHGSASPLSDILASIPLLPSLSSLSMSSTSASPLTTHQTALWSTIAHLFLNSKHSTLSPSPFTSSSSSSTTSKSKSSSLPSSSSSYSTSFSVARRLNLLSSVWSSITAFFLFLAATSFSLLDLSSILEEEPRPTSISSTFLPTLASWRPWAGLLACGIYILSAPVWAQSTQVGPAMFHAMLTSLLYLSLLLLEEESNRLESSSEGSSRGAEKKLLSRMFHQILPSKLSVLFFLIFLIFGWKAIDRDFSFILILPTFAFIKGQYSRIRESLADDEAVDGFRFFFLFSGVGFILGFLTPFILSYPSLTSLSFPFHPSSFPSSSGSSLQQTLTPLTEAWIRRWIDGRSSPFSHTFDLSLYRLKLYVNVIVRGWWWTLPTFFFCVFKRWTLPLAFSLTEVLAVVIQPLLISDAELLTKYHPSPLLRSSAATAPSSRAGELEVLPFFPQLPLIMAICFPHILWTFIRKITPGARYQFRQFVFASIAITVVVTQLWYSSISSVHNRPNQLNSVMVYGNTILDTMPPEAIILINSELAENVLNYLQHCESKRKDITLINLRGMSYFPPSSSPATHKRLVFAPEHPRFTSPSSLGSSSQSIVASFASLNIDTYPITYCGDWHESDSSMLQLAESSFVALPFGFCFQLFRREKKPDYKAWTASLDEEGEGSREREGGRRELLPLREELRTPSWDWDPNAQWDAAVLDAYWQAKHYLAHYALNRAIEIQKNRRESKEHRKASELSARLYSSIALHNPNTSGKHIWFNLALSLDQLRSHISSSSPSSSSSETETSGSNSSSSSSSSSSPSSSATVQIVTDMVFSYKRYLALESPAHPNYETIQKLVMEWEQYLAKQNTAAK